MCNWQSEGRTQPVNMISLVLLEIFSNSPSTKYQYIWTLTESIYNLNDYILLRFTMKGTFIQVPNQYINDYIQLFRFRFI